MFSRAPEDSSVEGYLRAHGVVGSLQRLAQNELRVIDIIVLKKLDAVGIEPWLRVDKERHALSRKLLLVAYLGESEDHMSHRPRKQQLLKRHSVVVFWGVAGVLSLIRGFWQKVIYGLV